MGRALAWAAACLLPLAGCSSSEERNGSEVSDRNAVAKDLAAVEVRPGLWEVSSELLSASQPGIPLEIAERMKGPRGSVRHCMTPEQAARPDANFVAGRRSGECSYAGFEMREGRIAGRMTCRAADGSETRARMSGSYGPERFDIRMDMETPGFGAATLAVVMRQSGRRLGECRPEGGTKR